MVFAADQTKIKGTAPGTNLKDSSRSWILLGKFFLAQRDGGAGKTLLVDHVWLVEAAWVWEPCQE